MAILSATDISKSAEAYHMHYIPKGERIKQVSTVQVSDNIIQYLTSHHNTKQQKCFCLTIFKAQIWYVIGQVGHALLKFEPSTMLDPRHKSRGNRRICGSV